MRLAALFSGGKDSTFSIYQMQRLGHEISCLLTIIPNSEESMLLHYPNIQITALQARSMRIPHVFVRSTSDDTKYELKLIESSLSEVKQHHDIEGLVHGGIRSNFQRNGFDKICTKVGLEILEPLWETKPVEYIKKLINNRFVFIITVVSAAGLDDSWLGKTVTCKSLDELVKLSEKYGFNVDFEGGEAETLVLDCPLFDRAIRIQKSRTSWDGYRGRFEIQEAILKDNA